MTHAIVPTEYEQDVKRCLGEAFDLQGLDASHPQYQITRQEDVNRGL